MERHDVLAMMTALKLAGMRAAYDDILADGLKRRHPVQQIIGTLLQTEVADKQARSIKYQMTSAKLPTAKELADFDFAASPGNEPLIQELAGGDFLESKRNIVLVGGTGTGKTPSRRRHRPRLYQKGRPWPLLQRRRPGQPPRGRTPLRTPRPYRGPTRPTRLRHPRRTWLSALRSGRRPAAVPPDEPALRAHLDHRHHQPRFQRMALRLRRPQDDHSPARPPDPPLRDHRDRQRELALQEPLLTGRRPCLRPACPGGSTGLTYTSSPRGFAPRTARRYTKPLGSPLLTTGTTSAVPLRGSILHADRGSILDAD